MQTLRLKVLDKALNYVPEHGFTLNSIQRALQDLQLSSGFNGCTQPIDLIEYHQKELIKPLSTTESDFYAKVRDLFIKRSNSMRNVSSHWVNATAELSKSPFMASQILQSQCHFILNAAGDKSVDMNWYYRYVLLGKMIIATDLYMTQDKSNNMEATDKFCSESMTKFKELDKLGHKIYLKADMVLNSGFKRVNL